jgi:CDP-glucose 4,6-dehydratase
MARESFWRRRSIFVTGATGFLGSHLVRSLVDHGAHVVILRRDRRPAGGVSAGWLGSVSVIDGNIVDTALLQRVLEEFAVETVFHVAAQTQVGVGRRRPAGTFDDNVRGTWSVLEAVRTSASVRQVVLASSDKAYGAQPALPYDESMPLLAVEPYDASKACAETIARSYAGAYGVPLTITRCANFYGPGDRNWRRIVPGTLLSILRGDAPIIRSDGSLVRDYLYVKDGVSAYLRLAEAMVADPALIGQAFNFSAEEPLTVLQMVDRIQAAAGTSIEPIVEGRAVGEIQEQHLSARKARELLAWQPAYTLDEGLLETVAYYRRVVADEGAVVG